jgi:hypothetical protein
MEPHDDESTALSATEARGARIFQQRRIQVEAGPAIPARNDH